MSSATQGESWEKKVRRAVKNAGLHEHGTAGSGAKFDDADVIIPCGRWMLECKSQEERAGKPRKNMTISKAHWNKIKDQAARQFKNPALAICNGVGDEVVVISLTNFVGLIAELDECYTQIEELEKTKDGEEEKLS